MTEVNTTNPSVTIEFYNRICVLFLRRGEHSAILILEYWNSNAQVLQISGNIMDYITIEKSKNSRVIIITTNGSLGTIGIIAIGAKSVI